MAKDKRDNLIAVIGRRVPARWLLVALLIALTVLVSVELTRDSLEYLHAYRQAQTVRQTEAIIGHVVRAAQHLAFERGRTNVVLQGQDPVSAEDLAFLAQRRQAGDGEVEAALALLDDSRASLAGKITRERRALLALRRSVDAQLVLPRPQRETGFADHWFQAVSAMLAGVPQTIALLGGEEALPPFSRVIFLAFELRDAMGMESSQIAAALAVGRVPDAAARDHLNRLHGRVDAAWSNLRREAILVDNQAISDALSKIDVLAFGNFRPLQDAVLHVFSNGQLPSEPVTFFTQASVPVLDSVAEMMSVAAQEDALLSDERLRQTRMATLLYCGALILTGVVGLVVAAATAGIVGSATSLRRYLADLAAGRLDRPAPVLMVGRELVELCQAADTLRHYMIERQRMQDAVERLSRQNRLILDHAIDGLVALDSQGRILLANRAFQRLSGWSLADVEGRGHHELLHHSHLNGSPNRREDCPVYLTLADGRSRFCQGEVIWRKDGTYFLAEMRVNAWSEGGQHGVVVSLRDLNQVPEDNSGPASRTGTGVTT